MIILRQGDRLPTVALLQSYLNQEPSSAEFLTVDGIFGPRTATAVRTYRMAHRLGSGETADHRVWNGVVGGEWQIIDSVDRSDHDSPVRRRRIEDHGDLAPYGQTVLEQFGMTAGTGPTVRNVQARARLGQVVLLRFHGHGSPGNMIIASGVEGNAASSLHQGYGEGFFQWLQLLRPIFAPLGSVEMHGCRVGRGYAGRSLLLGMANALGVPVSAGINPQYGGGTATFHFEGPTRTICPNDEPLRSWARRVGSVSEPRPVVRHPTRR